MLGKRAPGIRLAKRGQAADGTPMVMPPPERVRIPLCPAGAAVGGQLVKKGDRVSVGQPLTAPESGTPVYASVSGTVEGFEGIRMPDGVRVEAAVIASDGQQTLWDGVTPPVVDSRESFLEAVRLSGAVDADVDSLPAWEKLGMEAEYLIIDGSDSEPYCAVEHVALRDSIADVAEGVGLLQKYGGAGKLIVALKQPPAGAEEALRGIPNAELRQLRDFYPASAEKVLVREFTGRVIPAGKGAGDVGCVVLKASTAACLARYIRTGMPLVSRTVAVGGSALNSPALIAAPIGTPVGKVLEAAGGCKGEPAKVIAGGPMTGVSVPDLDHPLPWDCAALLALDEKEAKLPTPGPCIRCGRCVNACPMNLMPFDLTKAYQDRDMDALSRLGVGQCIECGCCAYVCPAKRDLVTNNKLAKALLSPETKKEAVRK